MLRLAASCLLFSAAVALRFQSTCFKIYLADVSCGNRLLSILFRSLNTEKSIASFGDLLRTRSLPIQKKFLRLLGSITEEDRAKLTVLALFMNKLECKDDAFENCDLLMPIRSVSLASFYQRIQKIELIPERIGKIAMELTHGTWGTLPDILIDNQQLLSTKTFFEHAGAMEGLGTNPKLWHLLDGECFMANLLIRERLWLMKSLLNFGHPLCLDEMEGLEPLLRLQQLVVASQYAHIPLKDPQNPIIELFVVQGHEFACELIQRILSSKLRFGEFYATLLGIFKVMLKAPKNVPIKLYPNLQKLWHKLWSLMPSMAVNRALIATLVMMVISQDATEKILTERIQNLLAKRKGLNRRDLYMLLIFMLDWLPAALQSGAVSIVWEELVQTLDIEVILKTNRAHFGLLAPVVTQFANAKVQKMLRHCMLESLQSYHIKEAGAANIGNRQHVAAAVKTLVRENCLVVGRRSSGAPILLPMIETHQCTENSMWSLIRIAFILNIPLPFTFHADYLRVVFATTGIERKAARVDFLDAILRHQFSPKRNFHERNLSVHLLVLLRQSEKLYQYQFCGQKHSNSLERLRLFRLHVESHNALLDKPHPWLESVDLHRVLRVLGEAVWKHRIYSMCATPLGLLQDPELIQQILFE